MIHFTELISSVPGITEEEKELHLKLFKKEVVPRKTIITEKGKPERFLSFIEEGILRYYLLDEERMKEVTFAFSFAGRFSSAYDSFITQQPCRYSVETMKETVLYRIDYDSVQVLYTETRIGNLIGRKSAENLFLSKAEGELSLLTQTAEERYLDLMHRRPEILEHIPLKYIASYIGVTPQALSRIRARIY